jgi:hypothetical protein
MHAVLKHWHPMLGRDMHIPWPPGSPIPAPAPVPYFTISTMFGTGVTASYAPSHLSQGAGMSMTITTDIGPAIPHIGPPSTTLPLVMLFSSSKSYFGPAATQAEGKPIAVALLIQVNPNLNCSEPVPLPVGTVVALNTHYVGMTMADILGGLGEALSDFIIQAVLQRLGGALGDKVGGWLSNRFFQKVFQQRYIAEILRGGPLDLAAARAGVQAAAALEGRLGLRYAGTAIENVFGIFMGGPMGIDAGTFGAPTPGGWVGDEGSGLGRQLGESLGRPLDDYLNSPDPNIGDYPQPSGDTATA